MLIPVTSKARVRRTGISPLHLAAERNRDDVLEMLIEAGFDVNAQLSAERMRLYEDRRSTALYFAVINNNIEAVRLLVTAGADPNLDMFRPLMVAARMGCVQIVKLLVEHGADINAGIPTHPTTFPAVYMFSMKYLPLFKYLLDHGGHALPCFDCAYGNRPHPPLKTSRSNWNDDSDQAVAEAPLRRGVQFCEMISAPSICRWAGPIIDVLLDYVGHVTLCSRLMEHLDSYSGWSAIKEKADRLGGVSTGCHGDSLQVWSFLPVASSSSSSSPTQRADSPACRRPSCRRPSCRRPACRRPSCRSPSCRRPSCRRPSCRRPGREPWIPAAAGRLHRHLHVIGDPLDGLQRLLLSAEQNQNRR